MLEERPILQRSLIGFGAFSFVFAAAMSGTAFMISGGFDLGGDNPHPHAMQDSAVVMETAWTDWTRPAYAATSAYVTPSPARSTATPDEADFASYGTTDVLDGDAQVVRHDSVDPRSEADILRDIERELAAYESESAAYAEPVEQPAYAEPTYAEPQTEANIITAKEGDAAMQGYGPY